MIELLLALATIGLLIQLGRQDKRLQQLERTLEVWKKHQQAQSVWIETLEERLGLAPVRERSLTEAPPSRGSTAKARGGPLLPPLPPPAAPSATSKPPASRPLQDAPRAPRPQPEGPSAWQSRGRRVWKRAERLFIENWSGILGVLVVVAGVTFVAINVALRLGPFHRFLLVAAAALALAVPSVLMGRREPWRNLTSWMRSGGAALLLFACAASGGLPQLGLQWIQDPRQGLAFIGLGMGVNLVLAGIARTPTIASLHAVVNLLPLVIVPQTGVTLAIASVVAVVGARLPLGRHWTRHQLVVSLAYAAYHVSWFLRCQTLLEGGGSLRLAAALAAVVVFGSSALLEQRSRLVPAQVEPLPLVLQVSHWGALALALMVYPQQATTRAGALALAALGLLALALRARRRGVRWLHLTNALVAQAFAVAAVASLQPLMTNTPLLLLALLGECVLFLGLGVVEDEDTIRRIGWGLTALAGAALPLAGLAPALEGAGSPGVLQNSLVLIGGAVLTTGVQGLLHRRAVAVPQPSLLGWLVGAQAFVATAVAPADTLRPLLALGVIGGLLLVARRLRPPGLLEGLAAAVLGLQITEWVWLMASHPLAPKALLAHLLPMAALALVLIWTARGTPYRLLGLDLLGLHAGLGAYLLLDPIAPQLPGVAWLMMALIALEAANQLRQEEALHTLVLAVGYLVAFAGSFLLVSIQSPAYVGTGGFTVRGRLLIEWFAIAVALYAWAFQPGPRLAQLKLWQRIQPCFLEVALVGAGLTILTEIPVLWRPVAWSLLALALICPPLNRVFPIRMQLYSVFFYWVGVATLLAMLSTLESPSPHWWEQPRQIAIGAMALQVGFIVASLRWLNLEQLRQPGGLPILAWVGQGIAKQRNSWLYYPMFAAVALYLSIRYDRSLLTLLWSAQAFGLYVLSAIVRENHFRYVALLALGACLVRLLAIDMAQADLGLRGLVFIGVGLMLLAMNAIYNRFRSRFE